MTLRPPEPGYPTVAGLLLACALAVVSAVSPAWSWA